jgi:hypothetical protein
MVTLRGLLVSLKSSIVVVITASGRVLAYMLSKSSRIVMVGTTSSILPLVATEMALTEHGAI